MTFISICAIIANEDVKNLKGGVALKNSANAKIYDFPVEAASQPQAKVILMPIFRESESRGNRIRIVLKETVKTVLGATLVLGFLILFAFGLMNTPAAQKNGRFMNGIPKHVVSRMFLSVVAKNYREFEIKRFEESHPEFPRRQAGFFSLD